MTCYMFPKLVKINASGCKRPEKGLQRRMEFLFDMKMEGPQVKGQTEIFPVLALE